MPKKKTPKKKKAAKKATKKVAKKAAKKATKKKAAKKAAKPAKAWIHIIEVDALTKVRFYRDKVGEFRWTVIKRGHIIGASTEGYKRKAAVYSNFSSLADTMRLVNLDQEASQRPKAA